MRRLAGMLTMVAVVSMVLLSGDALEALGIPYEDPNAPAYAKLHPSTILVLAAFGLLALARGNPAGFVVSGIGRFPLPWIYIIILAWVVGLIVTFSTATAVAALLEALIVPAVLALLIVSFPPDWRGRCFRVVFALLVVNAAVAVVEAALEARLVPSAMMEGRIHFRATAFLGHPLNNALLTSVAAVLAYGVVHGRLRKSVVILLFMTALLAYGGRMAMAAAVFGLLFLVTVRFLADLLRGRFTTGQGVIGLAALFSAPALVLCVALFTSIGERLMSHLSWDGSAQSRVQSLLVLENLSREELLFGMSVERIEALVAQEMATGFVGSGLENYWVVLLMRMGLLMFVPFVLAFIGFLAWMWRQTTLEARLSLLLFVAVSSTNNALSVKNTVFSILVALVLCARWRDLPARRRVRPPARVPLAAPAAVRPGSAAP